jgi:hypothetical protein
MTFSLQLKLSYFSTGLRAYLGRIITEGDRAGIKPPFWIVASYVLANWHFSGGYLSIQFAMDHKDKIKACITEFPSLDLERANSQVLAKHPARVLKLSRSTSRSRSKGQQSKLGHDAFTVSAHHFYYSRRAISGFLW